MKKILALVLAMLLVLGMTSAFAASVTIQGQTDTDGVIYGHTFKAYKVLNGNWEGGVLTNITNGNGVDWSSSEMLAALSTATSKTVTDGKTLADALDGVTSDTVAKAVALALKGHVISTNAIPLTGDDKVTNLEDGYYVIIDETTIGNDEVTNATVLQVAGDNVNIQVKTSTTTVEKKIDGATDADDETTAATDANDGQVGDLVPYIITATIADTTNYDHYYFEMNDTVSDGLDISATTATGDDAYSAYEVYDNGTKITTGFNLTNPTARTIKLVINDAKALGGHTITLKYKAKINQNAVTGEAGNPNTVTLTYSNQPDHSGVGEYATYTTTTPQDIVKTFVTGIQVKKVDAEDNTKVLEGAVFEISTDRCALSTVRTVHGFEVDNTNGTYYKLKTGEYTQAIPGAPGSPADDAYESTTTKYKPTTTTTVEKEVGSTKVSGTTGTDGLLLFDKLGEGTYTIHEVTAPEGYNKLDHDISFTIVCTEPDQIIDQTTNCTWTVTGVSTGDNVQYDPANKLFVITIENGSGTQLPSTGGVGTTLFYVGGGILVLLAVIFLVTKRRMGNEE